MKTAVELEIEIMENEGILKYGTFSEWASPIVIVPRSDGRLFICGDYKRTVNACLDNDTFPQPTPEELFSKTHVGKKFSKTDVTSVLTNAVRGAVAKIFNNQHFQKTKAIYENVLQSKTGKWNISKIHQK